MADFNAKSKQGGKGGSRNAGFAKNPQMKAAKRKKRAPFTFESFDQSPTDAGVDPTVYSTAGTHVYNIPKNVDTLRIHMYGAGGGGGAKPSKSAGAGGGGGAFVGLTLEEVGRTKTITFVVGAGGVTHATNDGTSGGDTYFQWVDAGGTAHGYTAGGGGSGLSNSIPGTDNGGIAQGMTSQGRNPGLGSTQGVTSLLLIDGERGAGGGPVYPSASAMPTSSGGTGGTTDSATGLAMNDFARGGSGETNLNEHIDGKPGLVYIF